MSDAHDMSEYTIEQLFDELAKRGPAVCLSIETNSNADDDNAALFYHTGKIVSRIGLLQSHLTLTQTHLCRTHGVDDSDDDLSGDGDE